MSTWAETKLAEINDLRQKLALEERISQLRQEIIVRQQTEIQALTELLQLNARHD